MIISGELNIGENYSMIFLKCSTWICNNLLTWKLIFKEPASGLKNLKFFYYWLILYIDRNI
ncbi:hypothetical protein J2X77_004730 [Sphingobacterium sp. 2149]|nr:hypothetical protein [Sphingobacterium sp. 2149]